MPEGTFDEWRQFVGTAIAVLQAEVKHLGVESHRVVEGLQTRVDAVFDRVNNGFSARLIKSEQNLALLEQRVADITSTVTSFKGFIAKIAGGILLAVILSVATGYLTLQSQTSDLSQKVESLTRQLALRNMTPP